MVFEVELTNDGIGNETILVLYTGLLGNYDGIKAETDGYVLNDALPFEFTNVKRHTVYKKLITIARGPIVYKSNGGVILCILHIIIETK